MSTKGIEGKDDVDAGSEHGTLHQSTFGAEESDDGGMRGRYFQERDCDNEKDSERGREKSSLEPLLSLALHPNIAETVAERLIFSPPPPSRK